MVYVFLCIGQHRPAHASDSRFFSKTSDRKSPEFRLPGNMFHCLLLRRQNYKFTSPLKTLDWKFLGRSNHGAQAIPFFTVTSQSTYVCKSWTVQELPRNLFAGRGDPWASLAGGAARHS